MQDDDNKKRFEGLALMSMDMLYTKALRLTKNARDAEKLVQATYLRAFETFDRREVRPGPCRWFLSILKNEFQERLYPNQLCTVEH